MKKIFLLAIAGLISLAFTSCKNGDVEYDNPDGKATVYFAYQNPVRTLVMGEDEYDTSLDNMHQCIINAAMGGTISGRNTTLEVMVDNNLTNNVYFDLAAPYAVKPMPRDYYILGDDNSDTQHITYQGLKAGLKVTFTDKFFADPEAVNNTYVIPLVINRQVSGDPVTILTGTTLVEGETPQRTNYARWNVAPQDYVLYLVKYISKYDANYCRRGVDNVVTGGKSYNIVRHGASVEADEVISNVTTVALNKINYPITVAIEGMDPLTCNLVVTFDDNGKVTNITSTTPDVTATGTGEYQDKGELKSWNNKDRDRLCLDYKITFPDATIETKDTLVWQGRGVMTEEFTSKYGN